MYNLHRTAANFSSFQRSAHNVSITIFNSLPHTQRSMMNKVALKRHLTAHAFYTAVKC